MTSKRQSNRQTDKEMLEKLGERLRGHLDAHTAAMVDDCLAIYRNNEFVIMVCGEVSVGKSSFLNTMSTTPFLLTDQRETTAAITYLRSVRHALAEAGHEDEVKVTFRDAARQPEWLPIHDRGRLGELTTSLDGNREALSQVEKAEAFLRPETLELPPEITIIDTPGLNGSEPHADLTHSEMGKCHVALFLMDGSKFGTLTNREEFRRLCRYAPKVLFVISKWDLCRGAYLGEHPTRSGMEQVKRETFLPKLQAWVEDGTVSAEDIYVVSCQDVVQARSRWESLSPKEQGKTTVQSLLPSEDNDYFRLVERLRSIMQSNERRKMVGRRPLQTLLRLAEDRLAETETQLAQLDGDEIRHQQALAQQRHTQELEEGQVALEDVCGFVEGMVQRERQELSCLVKDGCAEVQRRFGEQLTGSARELCEGGTSWDDLAKGLSGLLTEHIEEPLQEHAEALGGFLAQVLELPEVPAIRLFVRRPWAVDDRRLEEQRARRESLATRQRQLEWAQEQTQAKLTDLSKAREAADQRIQRLQQRLTEEEDGVRQEIRRVSDAIRQLGERPAVRTRQRLMRWKRPKMGFFGKIKYEKVVEYVTEEDTSERDAWDARLHALQEEMQGLEERQKSYSPLRQEQNQLTSDQTRLEEEQTQAQRRLGTIRWQWAQCEQEQAELEKAGLTVCVELGQSALSKVLDSYAGVAGQMDKAVGDLLAEYRRRHTMLQRNQQNQASQGMQSQSQLLKRQACLEQERKEMDTLVKEFRARLD